MHEILAIEVLNLCGVLW